MAAVQDSREECRTRLELYNRCAATVQGHLHLICHLMLGGMIGTRWLARLTEQLGRTHLAATQPLLSVSTNPCSQEDKNREDAATAARMWNAPDHGDPFDWNSCSLVWIMNNDDQGRTLSILLLFIRTHSGSDQISVRAGMCAVSGMRCMPWAEGHLGACWWWYAIKYQWLVVGRLSGCLAGRFQLINQLKIKIGWSATEPDNTPSSLNAPFR